MLTRQIKMVDLPQSQSKTISISSKLNTCSLLNVNYTSIKLLKSSFPDPKSFEMKDYGVGNQI